MFKPPLAAISIIRIAAPLQALLQQLDIDVRLSFHGGVALQT